MSEDKNESTEQKTEQPVPSYPSAVQRTAALTREFPTPNSEQFKNNTEE